MRQVGQAKLGFYPTPKRIVEDIIRLLDIEPKGRILDPCCGEGEALSLLKNVFPETVTYGVELDNGRYEKSKEKVDYCLNCDAVGELKITNGVFDLLWENPPYDDDIKGADGKSLRLEKKFLMSHERYLNEKGGILVFIIPLHVLKHVKSILIKYADLQVLSFPEGEYEIYKQIVVLGRTTRSISSSLLTSNREYLENIIATVPMERAYDYLETTSDCDRIYKTSANTTELKTFYTSRINPEEAMELIKKSPLETIFSSFIETKEITSIRPMAELTEGHLAMLIAAGMMDGLLEARGERFVVKGFVQSMLKEREEFATDSMKLIRRTQYKITVNAINLTKKEFVRIAA